MWLVDTGLERILQAAKAHGGKGSKQTQHERHMLPSEGMHAYGKSSFFLEFSSRMDMCIVLGDSCWTIFGLTNLSLCDPCPKSGIKPFPV